MVLNDRTLLKRGPFIVEPFDRSAVQPASIDLHLADTFLVPPLTPWNTEPIDAAIHLGDRSTIPKYESVVTQTYTLHQGQLILGSTVEKVKIPADLVGSIEGRSSLARLGLFIHVTAGYIDPGFEGKITLEIYNVNPRPIILRPGVRICQMALSKLSGIAVRPYGSEGLGSHYQNQETVTGSKFDG
jgi:dCTP deaminase